MVFLLNFLNSNSCVQLQKELLTWLSEIRGCLVPCSPSFRVFPILNFPVTFLRLQPKVWHVPCVPLLSGAVWHYYNLACCFWYITANHLVLPEMTSYISSLWDEGFWVMGLLCLHQGPAISPGAAGALESQCWAFALSVSWSLASRLLLISPMQKKAHVPQTLGLSQLFQMM